MALQKKVRLESGDRFAFENIGDKLAGHYTATDEIDTDYGRSKRHALTTKKGLVTFFGNAQLNADLQDVPPGTYVEIELIGKKKVKRGMMKVFDFSFDLDDVDATSVQSVTTNAVSQDDSDDTAYDTQDPADEEDSKPLPRSTVNTRPAQVNANSANEVRNLLRKR